MKLKIIFFISLLAFQFCTILNSSAQNQIEQQKDSIYYTCSMHPEIRSIGPGDCPKCGMQLIKTSVYGDTGHKMKMDCGMMQGMDMDKMPNGNMGPQNQSNVVIDSTKHNAVMYTCSMHPEIQSSLPGNCPKCGMQLTLLSTPENKNGDSHKMKMGCGMMHGM